MILGVGIDAIEPERIAQAMERHGERMLRRFFTEAEREHCQSRHSPALHFAARFAAKEAFCKALGTGISGGIQWTDIEVVRSGDGQPALCIRGRALEVMVERGIDEALVSYSHTPTAAVAVVILQRGESRGRG